MQVKLCERGCKHPAVPSRLKVMGKTHLELHKGIVPGQTPNYHLENEEWTLCLLHAGLCIVGGLLKRTLLAHLDKLVDPNSKESHGLQLYKLFLAHGVYMKLTTLAKRCKKLDQHDLAFKSQSFTGRAGEIVLRIINLVRRIFVCLCVCLFLHNRVCRSMVFVYYCMLSCLCLDHQDRDA